MINNRILDLAGLKEDYQVYHGTYSSAVQTARKRAEEKGYEIDEDDWFSEVNTGPGKPQPGKTVRHSIRLTKNGKPVKAALQIQVYRIDREKYELNTYIF